MVASNAGYDVEAVKLAMKRLDAADAAHHAELIGLRADPSQLARPRIGLLSEMGQRMLGGVDMTAGMLGGTVGSVNDALWASADLVAGGQLSKNLNVAKDAAYRNSVRGEMIWDASERAFGVALRLGTGNIGLDESYRGGRDFFQIDRAMQLEAAGDYRGAQAIWGSNVLLVTGVASSAFFLASKAVPLAGNAPIFVGKDASLGWPGRGGSGPVLGIIAINNTTSIKALQNYYPKEIGIEYVYDPIANQFAVGKPKSGFFDGSQHEKLAKSIGSYDNPRLVGGTLRRGSDGTIFTTENSGHYGRNWNESVRSKFTIWLEGRVGVPVNHENWKNK